MDFQHCNYVYDGGFDQFTFLASFDIKLQILDSQHACFKSKICIFVYLYSLKVPIVEAVLVELDHQQLGRDGAEDEVGIFDQHFYGKAVKKLKIFYYDH